MPDRGVTAVARSLAAAAAAGGLAMAIWSEGFFDMMTLPLKEKYK